LRKGRGKELLGCARSWWKKEKVGNEFLVSQKVTLMSCQIRQGLAGEIDLKSVVEKRVAQLVKKNLRAKLRAGPEKNLSRARDDVFPGDRGIYALEEEKKKRGSRGRKGESAGSGFRLKVRVNGIEGRGIEKER